MASVKERQKRAESPPSFLKQIGEGLYLADTPEALLKIKEILKQGFGQSTLATKIDSQMKLPLADLPIETSNLKVAIFKRGYPFGNFTTGLWSEDCIIKVAHSLREVITEGKSTRRMAIYQISSSFPLVSQEGILKNDARIYISSVLEAGQKQETIKTIALFKPLFIQLSLSRKDDGSVVWMVFEDDGKVYRLPNDDEKSLLHVESEGQIVRISNQPKSPLKSFRVELPLASVRQESPSTPSKG